VFGVPIGLKIVPAPWSLMVAVPTTALRPLGVAVSVRVSPLSLRVSSTTGVRTSMVVPVSVGLGMVLLAIQVVPPSSEYSRLVAGVPEPKSVPPPVAVPAANTRLTVWPATPVTVKTA
jgi:hypothetical protein